MKKIGVLIFIFWVCFLVIKAEEPSPLIVAHRGASRQAPENTLPAFKLAWKKGADAIEGDFHLTKDGHIVCIHDKGTWRVAKKQLIIKNSTLEELRKLDVGVIRSKEYKGTVIPTIAEVFSTIPENKKIYIEIKCGKEIIPILLKEIEKSGLKKEQPIVISFDKEVIQEFKLKGSRYKAYWLSGFKKKGFKKIKPTLEKVLKTLKQIKADGFSSSKKHITESFIKSILKQGYEYHVWTIDDLSTARRFKKWGAKSITTNIPGELKKSLAKQKPPTKTKKP